MKDLEKIVVDSEAIATNKFVYRRKLGNGRLAFYDKIKTGTRSRILPSEGQLTIDAIETFWAAYGAIKSRINAKWKEMANLKFTDLYALYIASSYAEDKHSSSDVEGSAYYSGLKVMDIPSDEYFLIDTLMANFLAETQACNSGKHLARTTKGFFQRVQELAREHINTKYASNLADFESKYQVIVEDSFTARGTTVETHDPNEGKPNELVTFDDIGGYDCIKEEMQYLCFAVKDPTQKAMGYVPPRGICFYGLPGTGKTLLAKAIACESGLPFHYTNIASLLSKWVGESEKNIFTALTRPGIHFLDEANSLLGVSSGTDSAHQDRLINVYAEAVDGFKSRSDAIYIIATNTLNLDKKAKRAGRIDEWHYFGLPEPAAIHHILQIHANKLREKASTEIMGLLDFNAITTAVYEKSLVANKKNPNLGMVPADCANILKMTHRRMLKNYWKTNEFHPMTTEDVLETVRNYNLEVRA